MRVTKVSGTANICQPMTVDKVEYDTKELRQLLGVYLKEQIDKRTATMKWADGKYEETTDLYFKAKKTKDVEMTHLWGHKAQGYYKIFVSNKLTIIDLKRLLQLTK
jgi:hypothetical protein